ncbi:MAG TPA: hypothetical protein VEY91_00640, partial [Candidatus Limnocylindria bacterium]|nr:hypothetical protein [Candidatus Limnocylindria bacterium]
QIPSGGTTRFENGEIITVADEPTGNLDSRTGTDVMELFERLHGEGHTIVVVTHDPEIAARAHRRVVLRDGAIESDKPTAARTGETGVST